MSIVATLKVGEGLVLAADSAAVIQTLGQQVGVANVYYNATKLFRLRDYPLGILTWGASTVGIRSMASLVGEFEHGRPAIGPDHLNPLTEIQVEREAEALQTFLMQTYEQAIPNFREIPENVRPATGFCLGGYSTGQFSSELYAFTIPEGGLRNLRPDSPDGHPDFGANWFGLTDAIIRFHHGRDDRLQGILQRVGVADAQATQVMEIFRGEIQYPIDFNGMPLQDAVAYTVFIISLVIARFRFVLGAPLCGGPIDVATITWKEGFQWVQRKQVIATEPGGSHG